MILTLENRLYIPLPLLFLFESIALLLCTVCTCYSFSIEFHSIQWTIMIIFLKFY